MFGTCKSFNFDRIEPIISNFGPLVYYGLNSGLGSKNDRKKSGRFSLSTWMLPNGADKRKTGNDQRIYW